MDDQARVRDREPDLFDHHVGRWKDTIGYVRRKQARKLMAKVEKLVEDTSPTFPRQCMEVRDYAVRIGAHSVARAVRWYCRPGDLSRHGYDAMTARLKRVARNYLARQEEL